MNYNTTQVGVPYCRATNIEINWTDGSTPKTVRVWQHLAVKLADGTVRNLEPLQQFTSELIFSDDPIPLVDPETGDPLGADTNSNMVMLGVLALLRAEQIKRNP